MIGFCHLDDKMRLLFALKLYPSLLDLQALHIILCIFFALGHLLFVEPLDPRLIPNRLDGKPYELV